MTTARKRASTLELVVGATAFQSYPVENELKEAENTNRVHPLQRRRLLQVLHSTRALNSALLVIAGNNGIVARGNDRSIGRLLYKLQGIGLLNQKIVPHFISSICNVRNRQMHVADVFPHPAETGTLLGNVHTCLALLIK
jgi:hypothetical protein